MTHHWNVLPEDVVNAKTVTLSRIGSTEGGQLKILSKLLAGQLQLQLQVQLC